MNPFAVVEEPEEPCPSCGIRGWVWICARTQRTGCQACGECTRIRVDAPPDLDHRTGREVMRG